MATKGLAVILVMFLGGIAAIGDEGIVHGSPFGVAFGEGSRNLDRFMDYIHDLGLTRTKVSFYWHELEPQPGVYDFTALDQYLSQLGPDDHALLNVFTDGWCVRERRPCKGAPLADCPYNAASCGTSCAERYREFILALAEHVKEAAHGGVKYWQRDTEPASPFPYYPADAPEEYVELQRIFYEAVKSVFPDAIVIGGNQNGEFTPAGEPANAEFFDYFLANARDWFDVLDVRLYGDVYTIPARVAWFRDRMHRYGYEKPIVSTEQGGPDPRVITGQGRMSPFFELLARARSACSQAGLKSRGTCFQQYVRDHRDEINPKLWPFYFQDDSEQREIYDRMQAADIVTRNVIMLAAGVEATWWWNLQSIGTDPIFGKMRLMTDDYQPLPGYAVYKRLVATLGAVSAVTRIDVGDPDVYLYRIERDAGDAVYVAWHREAGADPYDSITAPAVQVVLPIEISRPWIMDAQGNVVDYVGTAPLTLELGGMPLYIGQTE